MVAKEVDITRASGRLMLDFADEIFSLGSTLEQMINRLPDSINGTAGLLPSSRNQLRSSIEQSLDNNRIHSHTVAQFDDSALMKAFGTEGGWNIHCPASNRKKIMQPYRVKACGHTANVKEFFYAICVEIRIVNPIASTIIKYANNSLFAKEI